MEEHLLVNDVLSGSQNATRKFILKYERLVTYMICKVVPVREDAEELVQDVFIKVIDRLATFKFESKLSTWIATIAYRAALNHAKKKKIEFVEISDVNFEVAETSSEEVRSDTSTYIQYMIDQLPGKYKAVLVLFYLEGFSIKEIMKVTAQPEGTIKSYIHRARNLLKEKLLKEDSYE